MTETRTLITIENITKRYGNVVAVDNVSLEVRQGEFFALLGPSGCGKTTLLRMLAGFEIPSEGRILIDGVDMADVSPNKRPVNMVFQSYAVFPHMSVADNVAYGLKIDKVPQAERNIRVQEALDLVKLGDYGARKPDQLSGGQRQRVALARALVKRPKVLLLDEPLSALDAKLREAMRFELAQIQDKVGVTFVMVTHDQDEALAMACRCALMNNGTLQQLGTPNELYEYPANRFTADFIGSVNMLEGKLIKDERDHAVIDTPAVNGKVYLDHGVSGATGAIVWAAIRPEKIEMLPRDELTPLPPLADTPAGHNLLMGTIRDYAYLGSETVYEVQVGTQVLKVLRPNAQRYDARGFDYGQPVWLRWHPQAPAILMA